MNTTKGSESKAGLDDFAIIEHATDYDEIKVAGKR